MKIFDMMAKYHYNQVLENERYRKILSPEQDLDIEKFKQFLQRLEDMKEEKNRE